MKSKVEALATLMALVVALATFSVPAFAASASLAPLQSGQPIAFMGPPVVNGTNGAVYFLGVSYVNQSPGVMNGTVVAVLHNYLGQTVEIATASFSDIAAGQNSTATMGLFVPFDAYTVDVFAISTGGWAISAEVNATLAA